jgi:ribosomal protein L11 methylase PrmA
MLSMAKVSTNDLLYDLGSGDGRIVITAAREYGARGVGYDLNPERIKESNVNARRAGVTNRVRFTQQDLFEADLSGATVVTLYLLPDVNLKLRPKLLRDLRPGTRIVSHNYHMGDWQPQEVAEVEVKGTKHYVYFWIVPAAGKVGN